MNMYAERAIQLFTVCFENCFLDFVLLKLSFINLLLNLPINFFINNVTSSGNSSL